MWSPGHAERSNSITAGTEVGTKIIGGKVVSSNRLSISISVCIHMGGGKVISSRGDDIGSGLLSMSVLLHFCSTYVAVSVLGTRTTTNFDGITR